jgi:hypothetical protein
MNKFKRLWSSSWIFREFLAPVYYIPNLNCRLISMGTLLRNGMTVYGNSKCVKILTESKQVFLKFRPRKDSDTIYCIRLLPKNECVAYSVAQDIDYQTWNRRFAHPLHDVLKHAQKHTKGFNQVEFPQNESICQGCAQGKMPWQTFYYITHSIFTAVKCNKNSGKLSCFSSFF